MSQGLWYAASALPEHQWLSAGAVTLLAGISLPALSAAVWAASAWGVPSLLSVAPALWLAMGAALCCATALSAQLLQPTLSAQRPLRMYGATFARWWLVRPSLPASHKKRGTNIRVPM